MCNTIQKSYKFKSVLIQPNGWVFAPLPSSLKIEAVHPFGRTLIVATIDNNSWNTSIWTQKDGQSMIAIPKKIRGSLCKGDTVKIKFKFDYDRFV